MGLVPAPTKAGFFWNQDATQDSSLNALILESLLKAALLVKWPARLGRQGWYPTPSRSTFSLSLHPPLLCLSVSLSPPAKRGETGKMCNFQLLIVMPRSLLS